jgi:hypothetical protein
MVVSSKPKATAMVILDPSEREDPPASEQEALTALYEVVVTAYAEEHEQGLSHARPDWSWDREEEQEGKDGDANDEGQERVAALAAGAKEQGPEGDEPPPPSPKRQAPKLTHKEVQDEKWERYMRWYGTAAYPSKEVLSMFHTEDDDDDDGDDGDGGDGSDSNGDGDGAQATAAVAVAVAADDGEPDGAAAPSGEAGGEPEEEVVNWSVLRGEDFARAVHKEKAKKKRRAVELLEGKKVKIRQLCLCRELLCAAQDPAVLSEALAADLCSLEPLHDLPSLAELLAGTDGGEVSEDGEVRGMMMGAPSMRGALGSVRRWRAFRCWYWHGRKPREDIEAEERRERDKKRLKREILKMQEQARQKAKEEENDDHEDHPITAMLSGMDDGDDGSDSDDDDDEDDEEDMELDPSDVNVDEDSPDNEWVDDDEWEQQQAKRDKKEREKQKAYEKVNRQPTWLSLLFCASSYMLGLYNSLRRH